MSHAMFTLRLTWQRVLKTLTMKIFYENLNDIDKNQMVKRLLMLRCKVTTLFSTDQNASTPQCKSNIIWGLEQQDSKLQSCRNEDICFINSSFCSFWNEEWRMYSTWNDINPVYVKIYSSIPYGFNRNGMSSIRMSLNRDWCKRPLNWYSEHDKCMIYPPS